MLLMIINVYSSSPFWIESIVLQVRPCKTTSPVSLAELNRSVYLHDRKSPMQMKETSQWGSVCSGLYALQADTHILVTAKVGWPDMIHCVPALHWPNSLCTTTNKHLLRTLNTHDVDGSTCKYSHVLSQRQTYCAANLKNLGKHTPKPLQWLKMPQTHRHKYVCTHACMYSHLHT